MGGHALTNLFDQPSLVTVGARKDIRAAGGEVVFEGQPEQRAENGWLYLHPISFSRL